MKAARAATAQAYATALDAEFQSLMPTWQEDGVHLEDWAWDSHEHAEDFSYGGLPKIIPVDVHPDAEVQKCSDNRRVGNRMLHKHLLLGQPYQDKSAPVVEERLAMAGFRLAMILNEAAAHLH
jgi:hypothetical protein